MYIQFGLLHVELNIAQWWLIEGNPCNGGCGTVFSSACVSSEWLWLLLWHSIHWSMNACEC